MNGLVAILLLSAARAAADVYPIAPVDVVLRVEPGRLVADVDADSVYWMEEVAETESLPSLDWTPETRAKSEAYVNAHLRLTAEGRPLSGRLMFASYRQSLGQVNEQGRVHLRLVYPALAEDATLAGTADFFEEYRQERLKAKEALTDLNGNPEVFVTRLSIPGRISRSYDLIPGANAFSASVADARRTAFQLAAQSLGAGAVALSTAWVVWPTLFAVALSLGPGVPSRTRAAACAAAALGGALMPFPTPAAATWLAGAAAALGAGRWLGENAAPWLEAAALTVVGRAGAAGALADLPGTAPDFMERGLSVLGVVAAAAAALAAGIALLSLERRRLARVSETRVAELFARRRRLSATVIGIVCAWGLCAGRNW
jgi:hypothetical protein